jgi:hypothetical protein
VRCGYNFGPTAKNDINIACIYRGPLPQQQQRRGATAWRSGALAPRHCHDIPNKTGIKIYCVAVGSASLHRFLDEVKVVEARVFQHCAIGARTAFKHKDVASLDGRDRFEHFLEEVPRH